jgi:uncharacterized protein (UPF0212 family)
MAQAVNCHPLIEGPRIKFWFSPCEMCGGQIDSSLCKYSTSVFCVIIILQAFHAYTLNHHRHYLILANVCIVR